MPLIDLKQTSYNPTRSLNSYLSNHGRAFIRKSPNSIGSRTETIPWKFQAILYLDHNFKEKCGGKNLGWLIHWPSLAICVPCKLSRRRLKCTLQKNNSCQRRVAPCKYNTACSFAPSFSSIHIHLQCNFLDLF